MNTSNDFFKEITQADAEDKLFKPRQPDRFWFYAEQEKMRREGNWAAIVYLAGYMLPVLVLIGLVWIVLGTLV